MADKHIRFLHAETF